MKCMEIQLVSASNVMHFFSLWVGMGGGGGLVFRQWLLTHLPLVAYKARLGRPYAFQSAGGSPVLTVHFLCSQAVWLNFPPLYPCLPCVFIVFFFKKPGGQFKHKHSTSIKEMGKKGTIMMYKKTVREFEV